MVRRVTDRRAVEAALDEFDTIGRDAFLEKYNFGPALTYFVVRNGKRYDSKAVYGAAHRIQFPEDGEISTNDFSGGAQAVQSPLAALGFQFETNSSDEKQSEHATGTLPITSNDVLLIASSRHKKEYANLSSEEHAAYVRVTEALQFLGNQLQSSLKNANKFELRMTSGFNIHSGVRSYIPKDLWFSIAPKDNAKDLAGMPQLFMIVSERGIEYGFGASVSPSDFSQQSVKEIVRKAAPIVFDLLPQASSPEATSLQADIEGSSNWYFRRKHRLPPNQNDFSNLKDWLRYLQSEEGKKAAAGTISRYLRADQVDKADLTAEVAEMARLFEPLLDRQWHSSLVTAEGFRAPANDEGVKKEINMEASNQFADLLSTFLRVYGEKRGADFSVGEELSRAMKELQTWLEKEPAVASRPTIKVKMSVGQGGWTKTPWIAFLDARETTTTQHGTYVVFLIAEDLSVTYLTLNQGMTKLREALGQKGAAIEMVRVAEAARPHIADLASGGFHLDNNIDLHSETGAAKNYEIGTIAHVTLPSDELPNDETMQLYLENLLSAYDHLIQLRVGEGDAKLDHAVLVSEPEVTQPIPFSVDDALKELFLERVDIERYLNIWANKKNLILQGAPGVGKSYIARLLAYALIGFRHDRQVQTVQFHQSYSYEDFVQGYRPNGNQGFERKDGSFFEFRDRALKDPTSRYVFIIDEINRGNLSKIFGELMLLIEADKRDAKWATRLAYAAKDDPEFYVPENLYILGMMNTADRSLSLVDYALRRRFAFVAMEPLYGSPKFKAHLMAHGIPQDLVTRIVSGMGDLNQAIENDRTNLGPGFRIGHSFFTPTKQVIDPVDWYRRIVETEVHPLLQEYWFDAPDTADQWRDKLLA